ncbi:hypothetical protein [Rhizobium laguerreae]
MFPVVVLEYYIPNAANRDKSSSLGAMIVGWESVQDRMLIQ